MKRSQLRVLSLISCLLLMAGSHALADEKQSKDDDCLYAESSINKNRFLQNGKLIEKSWDKDNHILRAKTKDGERVVIQSWACENLSVEGTLYLNEHEPSVTLLRMKASWLADQVFGKDDATGVKQALKKLELTPDGEPQFIDGQEMSILYVKIGNESGLIAITLFGSME